MDFLKGKVEELKAAGIDAELFENGILLHSRKRNIGDFLLEIKEEVLKNPDKQIDEILNTLCTEYIDLFKNEKIILFFNSNRILRHQTTGKLDLQTPTTHKFPPLFVRENFGRMDYYSIKRGFENYTKETPYIEEIDYSLAFDTNVASDICKYYNKKTMTYNIEHKELFESVINKKM